MRIIHEINYKKIKITIFKHENKITIQAQRDLLMQSYNFRDGFNIRTNDQVTDLITLDFLESINNSLLNMRIHANNLLKHKLESEENEFDDII